jgi:hypothetical protein
MFVELLKGNLIGDTWRPRGSVLNLPDDAAKRLVDAKSAKISGGPEKVVAEDPEGDFEHTGDKTPDAVEVVEQLIAKRGPGRPKKDA